MKWFMMPERNRMTALVISKLASKKLVVIIELERDGIVPSIPPKGSLPACLPAVYVTWLVLERSIHSTPMPYHTIPYRRTDSCRAPWNGMEWNGMIYGTL
jgi:hypothetical protein